MNGSLDEIRLWNITLSQNAISNWMCNEITALHPNYNNLAGYWRLNEGVGTTTADLSFNGNNGTLMGLVQWQVTTSCFASNVVAKTYVPDDNFENYLEANGMGDGIALNDSVYTSAIDTVTYLDVSMGFPIFLDLTGIEDFTVLTELYCYSNQLTSLDISNNIFLTKLFCGDNQLTTLDVSSNTALITLYLGGNQLSNLDVSSNMVLTDLNCNYNQLSNLDVSSNTVLSTLYCSDNQFTSLDVSQNTALELLNCSGNQLTSLDVSANTSLIYLRCDDNQLTSLDLRNGNNQNMLTNNLHFNLSNNSQLNCINVDDIAWSTTNWTLANANIDAQHFFSNDCNATAIEETTSSEKELLKIVDVLGRENKGTKNKPLFYIYNDGTVEKQIIIE